MLFFTAVISVYILFTLMLNRRNKVIVSVCLHFLSIELFLFFSILYIAKIYQYTPLFDIDNDLFFLLLKPSLPVYSIVIAIALSICITVIADFMLMSTIKKLNIGIKILYGILISGFILLNHPEIRYSLMLRMNMIFCSLLYHLSKPFSVLLIVV